jgi:hypothetical protein
VPEVLVFWVGGITRARHRTGVSPYTKS